MTAREKSNDRLRLAFHFCSLSYLLMVAVMIVNQSNYLEKIIQKHFKLKIINVLHFFSTDNWLENLNNNLKLMGNDIVLLIIVEIVLIVVGLSLVGYLFWQLKKKDRWHFSEKLIGLGYIFLLLSLLTILTKMAINSYQTYNMINQKIMSMSLSELTAIQESLKELVLRSNLTLDNFIPNFLSLLEQIKELVNKTTAIAGIPKQLEVTWQSLLLLKNWLVGCSIVAIVMILVGHLVEGTAHLKLYNQLRIRLRKTKSSRQIELNERLVEVVEQQAKLITLFTEKEQSKRD